MPVEINLDSIPAGYSFFYPEKKSNQLLAVDGFFSTEDHDQFLLMLEGFPDQIVQRLPFDMRTIPSNIDHLIVVLGKDKTAKVFVNEVLFITDVEVRNGVKKGAFLRDEDIQLVRSMFPDGVDIPDDAGLLVLFSVGWRKGLFYDFRPIQPGQAGSKLYDVPVRLGKIYSYLLFQNKFTITAEQYRRMMSQQWFPFFTLSPGVIDEMLERTDKCKEIDGMVPKIKEFVDANVQSIGNRLLDAGVLSEQQDLAREVLSAYQDRDWMRSMLASGNWLAKLMQERQFYIAPGQEAASIQFVDRSHFLKNSDYRTCSELLPMQFKKFLATVFFCSFLRLSGDGSYAVGALEVMISENFLQKGALLGILCLDQMSFFLSGQKAPVNSAVQPPSKTENFNEEEAP